MANTITAGNATNGGTAISSDTSGVLELKTGSSPTTAIAVDASQNVGIGTASPAFKFDVQGVVARVGGATSGSAIAYTQYGSSATDLNNYVVGCETGSLAFYQGKYGGTSTERMRIDSSGRVGIGWTPSGSDGIFTVNINSIGFYLGYGANYDNYYTAGSSGIQVFRNANTERMRIDSSGKLLVGTTSISAGRVNVLAAGGASGIVVQVTNNGDYGLAFNNASGTNVGRIQIDSGSTSYVTSSDYRLKNSIAPMTGALAKVALLKPCTYKWNEDDSDADGFIAHELAQVCPQAVSGKKDAVDAEGNPIYQGIDTSFLVATLTAAIQELKAELDATKAEVAALKGA